MIRAKLNSVKHPTRPSWTQSLLLLPAVFLLARLASLLGLYLVATPTGQLVATDPWSLGRVSVLAEIGSFLVVFGLLGLALWKAPPRAGRAIWLVTLGTLVGYAILAEADVHLRRWMGLRLNLVFVRHFFTAAHEPGFWSMLRTYLDQDARSVALSGALILVPLAAALVLGRRQTEASRPRTYGWMIVLGAVAIAWSGHLGIALRKWRMLAPIPIPLAMDLARELRGAGKAPGPADIAALLQVIAPRRSDERYPMWHQARSEESLARFAQRPPDERLDVFVFAVESLRGWVADWRSPRMATLAPNLTALFKERGVAFVRNHSNGYPSGEGNANLNLGVWSHPSRALPVDHVAVRSRSLVQILRQAGYQSVWFTGSDPSFDNLQHFVARWYDRWELHPGGDVDLAQGLIKAYDGMKSDVPRFMSV